ncbi:hypothetical protein HZ994_11635 [Akkermansiaceae bacterium]|nr:hypothetical protein HZ994_11635 [Akkermansiaceae bacterium]
MKEDMSDQITYYGEGDTVYAAIGSFAHGGLFRLRYNPELRWDFLIPNSSDWDSSHQAIFRNYKLTEIRPEELPANLPPIPDSPAGSFDEEESASISETGIPADHYPVLHDALKAAGSGELQVFIVLEEDTYESKFGDGRFDYFEGAFFTEEAAQALVKSKERDWIRHHLLVDTIFLRDERISIRGTSREMFARHSLGEVAESLENLILAASSGA